jgi:hypothetical protein
MRPRSRSPSASRARPARRLVLAAALLLGAGPGAAAHAAVYKVGGTVGCTHVTLASAIAAAAANAGSDEIQLAQGESGLVGPLTIQDQTLTIRGVVSCADPTPAQRTLQFTAGDGLVMLGGTSSTRTLTLAAFDVIMTASAGRTLRIENRSLVQIEDVLLSGGNADVGANVRMIGANAILVLAEGAVVYAGEATLRGGGIDCAGGGTIGLLEGAGVRSNRSFGDGGGLALDGCTLNAFAGGPADEGVRDNRADGSGGGVYAVNGAELNLVGTASVPAMISDNRAFVSGGGVLLDGPATAGRATDARIEHNFADVYGGGVLVRNGADFVMERQRAACHDALRCSSLSENAIFHTSAPGGDGGAIAVLGGASAEIRQTYLTANDSYETGGTAYVDGAGSFLRVEGSMLYANSPGLSLDHVRVENGGRVVWGYNSTAANMLSTQVYFRLGANAVAEVYSSVFGETAGDLVDLDGPGASSPGDCVIRSRDAALRGDWGSFQVVRTPESLFRDVAAGDLHLRHGAEAVDFCDTFYYVPLDRDFDDEDRGLDRPEAPNSLGPYDAGADELLPAPGAAAGGLAAFAALAALARLRRGRDRRR